MFSINAYLTKLITVLAFVISMIVVLSVLRLFDDDFSDFIYGMRLPERLVTYTSNCKHEWSYASSISKTIQQRLHKTMPNPSKMIVIKSNRKSHWGGWESLKVFSIDARMGYVVQMTSSDSAKFMEKKLEQSVAEQIFSRLTEGEQRGLTGKSLKPEDIVYTSGGHSCEFLKLVYSTDTIQVEFIEGTVSPSDTLDQKHTGQRILINAHRFFAEIQAESEAIQSDAKYVDYRKHLWRRKQNFKDIFFELPNASQRPLE